MATATVTVLFTDLVGSTELLARLGEEAADAVRREHFALLREVIDRHGGREVKNLGDGLMVAFDGVGAGLSCAVAMQQAVTARPSSQPLSIRIGVATGEADEEGGDYFGLPVVEAARLCGVASGGEILTTELARMLARSRGGFDLEAVGPIELKGLPDPVEVFRVGWRPMGSESAHRVPIPPRVTAMAGAPLVGRRAERQVLDAALKEAAEGRRRAVLVSGEPGIGKTSLAAASAHQALDQGFVVVYGRCDEDLHVPYQPWAEALGHLVEHAPAVLLDAHVEACGRVLGRVVPRLSGHVSEGPAEASTERHLLFGAVVDLLERVSRWAPLFLLLDDLHWADGATVHLLRHVLAAGEMPLVLVGTFRDSDLGPDHDLTDALAALRREPGVERLPLRGLGDDELLELLERAAGHEMTDDGLALRDALSDETDGNPFFVGEMLRHLSETGAIYLDHLSGRWASGIDLRTAGLPVSIREVVGHRVARLGPETKRVLTMAAVIGRDFDLQLLEAVTEVDADRLVDLCDAAVAAAVLQETDVPDRYTFAHALIERSLYDELSTSRRVRAHRNVALALEALCGGDDGDHVGELAHHWAQATRPADAAKAISYARRAGDRAMASLAPDEAMRWYTEAFALLEPHQHRGTDGVALRIAIGEAQQQVGDTAFRTTLRAASHDAVTLDDGPLLVRAALAGSRMFASSVGGVDTERVALLRSALAKVGPSDSRERALLLSMLSVELQYDTSDHLERAASLDEAVAIARRLGDPATLVDVLATPFANPDGLEARHREVREALAAAEALGDPVRLWRARWAAWIAAFQRGDRDAMDDLVRLTLPAAERSGSAIWLLNALNQLALTCAVDGDPDRLEEVALRCLEHGQQTGNEDATIQWSAMTLQVAHQRGQLAELLPIMEQAVLDNPGLPIFRSSLTWVHAVAGDLDRAATLLAERRAEGFALPFDGLWLSANALLAEAAARTADAASAAVLSERLAPYRGYVSGTGATFEGALGYYEGMARSVLGELDLAVQLLEDAVALHRRMRAVHLGACSEVALAGVLLQRGGDDDRTRARALATAASDLAGRRGYGYVDRDARAVLARLASGPG
jgi:class 3 adenylate cyclase